MGPENGNGIGLLTAGGVHPIPQSAKQGPCRGHTSRTFRAYTCGYVCVHMGLGVDASLHSPGCLCAPPGRPHLPGSWCWAPAVLLGTSLLPPLPPVGTDTACSRGLDPQSPLPLASHPQGSHVPRAVSRRHPGRDGLHPLLPGRAEPLPRADFSISPGDSRAAPAAPAEHTPPRGGHAFLEPHRLISTGSDKKVVSGHEFIYMGKKKNLTQVQK